MSIEKEVKEFYEDRPYPQRSTKWVRGSAGTRMSRLLLERVGLEQKKELRILDAGCGTGSSCLSLAFHNPQIDVVAFDLSEAAVYYVKERSLELDIRNLSVFCASLFDVSESDAGIAGGFDCIISKGILHHTPDPAGGMKNLSSFLRPNGRFYLSLYHPGQWPNAIRRRVLDIFAGQNISDRSQMAGKLFPRYVRRRIEEEADKEAMLQDRFSHPLEHYCWLTEQARWMRECGLDILNVFPNWGLSNLTLIDTICVLRIVEQTAIVGVRPL